MSEFEDVAVCIPTVRQRAAVLELTLAEWRRFGVTPIVQLQPADWPLSDVSQRRNADITLHRTLRERPEARYVLFSEDDVLLAPELDLWIPALKALNLPVALFVSGLTFLPQSVQRMCVRNRPVAERIIRVRALGGWWGSQAVLLPREIVEALLQWESSLAGWDLHLQTFLRRQGIPMFTPIPNPVQQRDVPTSILIDRVVPHSLTFGRRSDGSGISPAQIDWCPHGDWNPDPRPLLLPDRRRRQQGGAAAALQ